MKFELVKKEDLHTILDLLITSMPGATKRKEYLKKFDFWWNNNPFFDENKHIRGWLIKTEGNIVGFIGLYPMKCYYKAKPLMLYAMTSLVLKKELRGQGLGIKFIKNMLAKTSCDGFFATTPNLTAMKIYQKLGFYSNKKIPINNKSFLIVGNTKTYARLLANNLLKTNYPILKVILTNILFIGVNLFHFKKKNIPPPYTFKINEVLTENAKSENNSTYFSLDKSPTTINWHYTENLANRLLFKIYDKNICIGYSLLAIKKDFYSSQKYLLMMHYDFFQNNKEEFLHIIYDNLCSFAKNNKFAYVQTWASSQKEYTTLKKKYTKTTKTHFNYQIYLKPALNINPNRIKPSLLDGDRGLQI